ncbi:MAG: hypothetical protein A3K03_03770, partial [Bdellovibrionales bacterium RIFOXYD1_FULL_44_7]
PFIKKYLAITDLELTGLDVRKHEIIEIAALLVHQESMDIIKIFESKVTPAHVETGDPVSLRIAGYEPDLWKEAPPLKEALEMYVSFLGNSDAVFAAWNNTTDWAFLEEGFKKTGTKDPFDYHRYDIWTAAAELLKGVDLEKISLSCIRTHLHLAVEPSPHRAINGARGAYEVLKKLRSNHEYTS